MERLGAVPNGVPALTGATGKKAEQTAGRAMTGFCGSGCGPARRTDTHITKNGCADEDDAGAFLRGAPTQTGRRVLLIMISSTGDGGNVMSLAAHARASSPGRGRGPLPGISPDNGPLSVRPPGLTPGTIEARPRVLHGLPPCLHAALRERCPGFIRHAEGTTLAPGISPDNRPGLECRPGLTPGGSCWIGSNRMESGYRLAEQTLHAVQLRQQFGAAFLELQGLLHHRAHLRVMLGKAARLRQRLQRLVDAVRKPPAAGQVAVTMRNRGWAFTLVSARVTGPVASSSSGVASAG